MTDWLETTRLETPEASSMKTTSLESTVQALLAPGKGILAADESLPTIGKRFKEFGIPSTEENHRAYRDMLFAAPGLNEFISGVILFDETIRQRTNRGARMPEALAALGIVPGIKVDAGAVPLALFPGEEITQGLDGLRQRLEEYRALGARFTKWRAVIKVGDRLPTRTSLEANATALALFAALSQEAGLVPIVEPEVLMDGSHTIARCEEVTAETLGRVFDALARHRVALESMLLKSGMVLSGEDCPEQAEAAAIAEATVRCFLRTVPAAVPGIVFLSGGQGDEAATKRLNAICAKGGVPWKLTFSFGRALQAPALKAWRGSPDNVAGGQAMLLHRAKCNGLAVLGRYTDKTEAGG
jgi:fructose-bisphosphate aldolase, class I